MPDRFEAHLFCPLQHGELAMHALLVSEHCIVSKHFWRFMTAEMCSPYRLVHSRGVEGSLRPLASGASTLFLECLNSKMKALWFFETSLFTSRYSVTSQKTVVPLWEPHLARDIFNTGVGKRQAF